MQVAPVCVCRWLRGRLLTVCGCGSRVQVLSAADQALLAEPLVTGDVVLSSIAAAVPLDVMPGESDPSNYTMPQQPLHRCLLPLTSRFSSYRPVTNPYDAEVHSVRFLGSSGQAVDDIVRYTEEDVLSSVDADGDVDAAGRAVDAAVDAAGPGAGAGAAPGSDAAGGSPAGDGAKATAASPSRAITALERSLTWRHLAPTAPDTLACYPFFDHDPFVIDTAPHIMFSGNHNAFATKHIKRACRRLCALRLCLLRRCDTHPPCCIAFAQLTTGLGHTW